MFDNCFLCNRYAIVLILKVMPSYVPNERTEEVDPLITTAKKFSGFATRFRLHQKDEFIDESYKQFISCSFFGKKV